MNKKFKCLTAMLMSTTLAASATMMAMPTFADDSYTITITKPTNDTATHTYEAYQVFDGNLSGTGANAVLSTIEWGTGVNGVNLLTALKASTAFGETNPFATCEDAAAVAKVLDDWSNDSANLQKFADIVGANLSSTKITGQAGNNNLTITSAGYYFIKDQDDTLDNAELGAYTDYILKVVDNVTITSKEDVPTIQKKIVEGEELKEANTASLGDVVTFQLDSKVPDMSAYNKYYYVINDKLCEGLTFNPNSVQITIGDGVVPPANYEIQTGEDAKVGDVQYSFQIVMKNFKANYSEKTGKDIKVTYSATLNDNADRTEKGNENLVNLTYSNNPNHEYKGENEPSNTPEDGDVTGKTPDSKTKTYTTGLLLHKVDGAHKETPLEGAVFALKGSGVNRVVIASKESFEEDANGIYYLLDDGTYTTNEPTEANKDKYASTTQKYSLKENTITEHQGSGSDSYVTATSDASGMLAFSGLGAGTYYLTETQAPNGYNTLANPIEIEITANPTFDSPGWTVKQDGKALTKPTGIYELTVENNQGATLPSTGGMGRMIFYIVGTLCIAGGLILLITKKRMNVKEK